MLDRGYITEQIGRSSGELQISIRKGKRTKKNYHL